MTKANGDWLPIFLAEMTADGNGKGSGACPLWPWRKAWPAVSPLPTYRGRVPDPFDLGENVVPACLRYKMSYGRMLEAQARMLAGHVRGDIPRYVGFTTR